MFILLIILHIHFFSTIIYAEKTYDFANFTEEDAISFVEEHNIEIPTKLLNWDELGSFTKDIIVQSYNDPSIPFGFNYSKTQKYAEDIRGAVGYYTSQNNVSTCSTSSYVLRNNTVMDENGNWVTSGGYYNQDWINYNCYAYALNRCEMSNFYVNRESLYDPSKVCTRCDYAVTTPHIFVYNSTDEYHILTCRKCENILSNLIPQSPWRLGNNDI